MARATLVHFSQIRLQNFEILGVTRFHYPLLLLLLLPSNGETLSAHYDDR